MRADEVALMLKFVARNNGADIYINPVHVAAIVDAPADGPDRCIIYTADGNGWAVRSDAADAQLRVWEALR